MRIVLDAMGSDTYPEPEIKAAIEAASLFGDKILLVGQEAQLRPRLQSAGDQSLVKIVHAPEVLKMTDKPAQNARRKAENSMAVGMELIKSNEADAFVTAGNTGGAMANALFRLGRIRGVKRPGLAVLLPVSGGRCVVLDVGANADCKPEFLLQFGQMGSVYAEIVLNSKPPRVALLSNGEETGKGNKLVKETYPLLESSGLNFIGNVEAKEIFGGQADVVVTDGFSGNVMIKASEAVAKFIIHLIRQELTSSLRTKMGALLAMPALTSIKKMLDPSEVGAATLLGVNGLVFVAHGRSDARALVSSIRMARQAVSANLLETLRTTIQDRIARIPSLEPA